MFFVRSHYRKPVEYSPEALADASRAVERIRELGRRLDAEAEPPDLGQFESRFYAELADDFNTPAALAVVFDCVAELNRRLEAGERVGAGALQGMLWTLGLED